MIKRLVWKISLLLILAACTVTGLVLLQRSGAGATVDVYAAEAAVTQDYLSYRLSDDGLYYILQGFAEGTSDADQKEIKIADAIGDIAVTEVDAGAFEGNSNVTSISIGANMSTYGAKAFGSLSSLESIYYGSTVQYSSSDKGSIKSGDCPFDGMGSGTENGVTITVSESAQGIPDYMFASSSANAGKLHNIIFESNSGFSYFGSYAFSDLSLSADAGVYITDLSAWCGSSFTYNASNPLETGLDLYLNNEICTDLVIPEDCTIISQYAFLGCKTLRRLTIHENVSSIGTGVFQACASLEYIYFDAVYCSVSSNAFYAIGTGTNGVTLVIGKDVSYIAQSAFAGLNSQTGNDIITFEKISTLGRIDNLAFSSSGFTSITIPGSVTYIGYSVFSDSGITADTLYLENPYDWYTTNKNGVTYDPDAAAAGIIENATSSGRSSNYAATVEVLRAYVDETTDESGFSVSLWWYVRYEWTAEISGTKADGTAVSGPYSNYDKITEPGEYAITLTNSNASDTLTFQIHIQDVFTTDPTCTEDGLEQYLVSYTVDGVTYELDPCDIILPATGHTYSSAPAYWTWEQMEGTAAYMAYACFECDEGDYTLPVAASVSLEDNGTTYIATVTFSDAEYTDSMHIHSYSLTSSGWSEDGTEYILNYACAGEESEACTGKTLTLYADVTSVTYPATCTEDGYTVYTAVFEGTIIGTNTITDEGTATGHTYGEPHWSWTMDEETNTLTAEATFYCTEWDDEKTISATIEKEPTDFATIYHATVTAPDGVTIYTSSESVAHLFNVSWEWTEATDGYSAKVTLTCQICNNSFEYEATVTKVAHRDATCTIAGYTRYEATFTLGSGDEAVTYTENKTDVIKALGHNYESTITASTCTEKGYTTYTCSRCGETYIDENSYKDALGHDYQYSSATWTWYETNSIAKVEISCSRCDDVITDYVQTTYAVTKEPACTATGVGTYTATYKYGENEEYSITDTREVEIPANGHTYTTDEQFSWTGDETNGYTAATLTFTCSVCQATETVDATIIVREEDPTTYVARAVFEGEIYRDSKHVHVYAISGTEWNEDGEGMSCTVTFTCIGTDCGESYTKTATVTSETTAATCTEDGQTVYTATYEDEAVDTKIVVIEATGHTYGEPSWEWIQAEDSSYTATATFFCDKGDNAVVVNATTTKDTDEEGSTYTATAYDPNHPDDDTYKYTATTNVEHILDASWSWEATTDADGKVSYTVTLTLTCQLCGTTFTHSGTLGDSSGDVTVTQVYHRDAACEVTGYTRYEATYIYEATGEADLTYTDTHVDTVDALEHEFYAVITHPTCTTGGYATYTCSECGYSFVGNETSALGHDYDYSSATWSWAGTSSAEAVLVCSVCGYEFRTEYLDSTSAITTPATCTEEGVTTYTVTWQYGTTAAASISNSITEAIPATGHSYDTENAVWAWTEDNTAAITFTCKTCSHEETVDAAVILGDNGTTYYATAVFESETYESSKHVHVYEITDTAWSEDNSGCTITFTCMGSECDDSYTAKADVTSETSVEPTCTEQGETLYTATYNGEVVSTATSEIAATGHTYSGEPTWSWDTDTDGKYTVTATFQCDAWDDDLVINATVTSTPSAFATTYTATVTAPDGVTRYSKERVVAHVFEVVWNWSETAHTASVTLTCQICGNEYTYGINNGVVVELKAERDATCTTRGYIVYEAEYTHGEGDEAVTYTSLHSDITDALDHNYVGTVTAPTCTEKGYTTHTCSRCGNTYVDDYTDATGHTYTSDSVEWIWINTSGAELIIICDTCGDAVIYEYIGSTSGVTEPTCTEDGTGTYTVTYEYTDADGASKTISDTKTESIPATGHTYLAADEWTWTEDEANGGYTATLTFTCSACEDEKVITADTVLGDSSTTYYASLTGPDGKEYTDAHHEHSYHITGVQWSDDYTTCTVLYACIGEYCGHDTSKTASATVTSETTVEATCTESGTIVYKATYDGASMSVVDVEIPATGHSYGDPEWSWSVAEDGTYSATAIFFCKEGDDEIKIEASVSSETESNNTTYTATVIGPDGETYTDSSTSHTHLYSVTWEWAEDGSSASITLTCVDGDSTITETDEIVIIQTAHVAAGCETEGYTTYKATFTGSEGTYHDVYTVAIDPHGHSYEAIDYDPTCIDAGYTLYRCRLCAVSYTEAGAPATGEHEIDEDSITWEWVLNEDGTYSAYAVFACYAGSSYHTVSYEAHMTSYVEVEETCGTAGIIVWTASYGWHANYIEVEIPATGQHDGTLTILSVDETGKTISATCVCSVCGLDYIDDCCIVVTDYYGNIYTIAFVNGIASYASVAYPSSIAVIDNNGVQIGTADITAVEPEEPTPDNPTEPTEPAEPAEPATPGGEEEDSIGSRVLEIVLIAVACLIVIAAIVLVIVLIRIRRKAKKAASGDTQDSGKSE